jgi:hypothetical protein
MFRAEAGERIKKITIGPDLKDGMSFVVGGPKRSTGFEISRIVRNEDNRFILGDVIYVVYAFRKEDPNKEEFVWKTFERVPITTEYFFPE